MCGQQIRFGLFTFLPNAAKQLNILTSTDIISWLGGAEVTNPLWVREVPDSILGSREFMALCIWPQAVKGPSQEGFQLNVSSK